MADYDFHQLSPHDFERMARDLLQAEWGLRLESFKIGKDGGIDFRYAEAGERVIVQCKHYVRTGLAGLLRDLAKEAGKIRKLRPRRYVLVTSVPLSSANKVKIIGILGANMVKSGDILGRDDLNNRLAQHQTVEGNHYKLWLASRAVLDRVLNNAIVTRSEFKVQKVYGDIRRYVQNSAFPRALAVLDDARFVIVAGPPGVGKTTLANMLLYEHLEKGYKAVVILQDIREGQALFQEGQRQIFYFDDFMGSTFLGDRGSTFYRNEDRAILEFIAMVQASKTARLVLTTREHILSQALTQSERMRHSGIGDQRVVLHMSDYTFGQRAQILYNHLYFSDLPIRYQDEMLRDDFYIQIIKHEKFNPRLVEWLSTYRRVKNVDVAAYRDFVRHLLQDPSEIWQHAYQNEISDAGRSLLLALFTLGGSASGSLLKSAFTALHAIRATRYGFERRPEDFRAAFRELAGAFIKPASTHSVEVLDPSVLDLLNAVVCGATDNAIDLILGSVNFDQIDRVWSFANTSQSEAVILAFAQEAKPIAAAIEPRLYDIRRHKVGESTVVYRGATFERRLAVLVSIADSLHHPSLLALIRPLAERLAVEWQTETVEIDDCIKILRAFETSSWPPLAKMTAVRTACRRALVAEVAKGCSSNELRELLSVLDLSDIVEGKALRRAFEEYKRRFFGDELSDCHSIEQFDGLLDDLEKFEGTLSTDAWLERERTLEAKAEFEEDQSARADAMQDEWKERRYEERASEASVREMFGSLKSDRG